MEEQVFRITMEGPYGEELTYDVVGTFTAENGRDYMALQPVGSEDSDIFLIGFHAGPDDEVIFDDIADDEEYAMVSDTFQQLFNAPLEEEYDLGDMYDTEKALGEVIGDTGDYCYEDDQGRLFVYGPGDIRIYLDENGEYILDEATVSALVASGAVPPPPQDDAAASASSGGYVPQGSYTAPASSDGYVPQDSYTSTALEWGYLESKDSTD